MEKCRARGGLYSGRAAHGGHGAEAPVAVLGRRRPVEGCGYAAGWLGNKVGKEGLRGVLGCARALGPAVSALGRRTACATWRGRGVLGLVLVRAAGARGDQEARESEGGHGAERCGAATSDDRRDMATCTWPLLSPASPRRLRPPFGSLRRAA